MQIQFKLDGTDRRIDVPAQTLLVDAIREHVGLTGTHVGCDTSQCGCCTVHLNGRAVKSCSMLAAQAEGADIVTIEGLGADGLHPVQQAFSRCHGLQCGFCTPGMIMASADFLRHHPNPSRADIEEALEGNLCRCTGYLNIVEAVHQAAQTLHKDRA